MSMTMETLSALEAACDGTVALAGYLDLFDDHDGSTAEAVKSWALRRGLRWETGEQADGRALLRVFGPRSVALPRVVVYAALVAAQEARA